VETACEIRGQQATGGQIGAR
jgi:hypothetical protein